ncbi:hypothetical protein M413DRAFT_439667 [Hebeloma cylindrosporum]|uniref:Uncharacterized protein n=1 Tax=Hebeloma cylindrosporum TaxID=76867 RepID=A0A0C2YDV7_HEBCY|nr:hypothetical protein M413DRAFT_439667 [Hebeloma cylindrosporum h7]
MPTSPRPVPDQVLQPEFAALTQCLRDVVIRTGQIYSFYADVHRLNIEKHVSNAPRALTAALGRDIEKYDQLCDSIEAQLLRAINVLRRDLRREEERIEKQRNLEASMLPPPVPHSLLEGMADDTQTPIETATNPRNSPISTLPARRMSTISISSLHRPQFPLKLDLSSTSLRITEEEAALYTRGLASPVTLAPKSARPVDSAEFSAELMAAFATSSVPLEVGHNTGNADLTLSAHKQPDVTIGVGDSSDKPIELDLDAMDMEMVDLADQFGVPAESGESNNVHDGLFSPLADDGEAQQLPDSNVDDELFGNFTSSADLDVDMSASPGTMLHQTTSVPSPGSLLAQFSSSSGVMDVKPSLPPGNPSIHDPVASFDLGSLDLTQLDTTQLDTTQLDPNFFTNSQETEMGFSIAMAAFLNSGNGSNVESGVEESDVNAALH